MVKIEVKSQAMEFRQLGSADEVEGVTAEALQQRRCTNVRRAGVRVLTVV